MFSELMAEEEVSSKLAKLIGPMAAVTYMIGTMVDVIGSTGVGPIRFC